MQILQRLHLDGAGLFCAAIHFDEDLLKVDGL